MVLRALALTLLILTGGTAAAQADQVISRSDAVAALERVCNYYDNRSRAASAIADPGEPGFLAPLLDACRTIELQGWLADADYAGSEQEQAAVHFALRSALVLTGLQRMTQDELGAANRASGMMRYGWGDTTLLLTLQHEDVFQIARHVRRLETAGQIAAQ